MTDEHIQVADEGAVRRITMDRAPKKNALTGGMYRAIAAAIDEAGAEGSGIRVLVLAGSEGIFTAGNDLNDFLAADEDDFAASAPGTFLRALTSTTLPVVAAVDGAAVGVGTTLLLHCEVVYVTERARLTLPFVSLGLCPEAASSLLLPAAIGQIRAARSLLLGEPITAREAVDWGLATAMVGVDELAATATAAAERLAALDPDAVRTTKRLLRAPATDVADRMAEEGREFNRLLRGEEFRRVAGAFVKRG